MVAGVVSTEECEKEIVEKIWGEEEIREQIYMSGIAGLLG